MKNGRLYLIPTTIGNHTESIVLSKEVYNTINKINIFIVENIRTSRRYIKSINPEIKIDDLTFLPFGKYDKINFEKDCLKYFLNGYDVGIISESGLPCIADPGSEIVKSAHKFNIKVIPISGPSSIFLSLMASGLTGQNFCFHGYLPIEKKERIYKLKKLESLSKRERQTQIFIETPYRNLKLFDSIINTCSNHTYLCIACDLTLDTEYISTKTISFWKNQIPDIHKRPTIFLISC